MMNFIHNTLFKRIICICLLGFVLAGCSHEGFKRAIMLPAAVEREDREKEAKANSLVIPPKWHTAPSQRELAKKPAQVSDAPLFTKENKPNPEAVEPDYEQERQEETEDHRTPR